jgi:uncharacterized protein
MLQEKHQKQPMTTLMTRSPRNVIVKVTNACNLACKYCYAGDAGSGVMSTPVLERLIESFAQLKQPVSFIWHGGEPLSAKLSFYEYAMYLQYWHSKRSGFHFRNNIQTNGTLVTNEVVDFCKRHDTRLGFSLDGPAEFHDDMRPFTNGTGSFSSVYSGMKLARENGVGGGGAIIVLNARTIPHLPEIYKFFASEGLNMKVNPLICAGHAKSHFAGLGITPAHYAEAMKALFDRYVSDCPRIAIEPFDSLIGNVAFDENKGICLFSENCQEGFICVTQNGDVYPCGRFDGSANWKYGNIMVANLDRILESPARNILLKRNAQANSVCKKCRFIKSCYGGCMNNGFTRRGNPMDRDFYCAGYKELFSYIESFVREQTKQATLN